MIGFEKENFALWTAIGLRHEMSILPGAEVDDSLTVSDCFERVKTDAQAIRLIAS